MRMWLARSMSKSLSRPFPSGLSAGCDIASVAFCRLLVTRELTPCIQCNISAVMRNRFPYSVIGIAALFLAATG